MKYFVWYDVVTNSLFVINEIFQDMFFNAQDLDQEFTCIGEL